jgi:hypothetical protein
MKMGRVCVWGSSRCAGGVSRPFFLRVRLVDGGGMEDETKKKSADKSKQPGKIWWKQKGVRSLDEEIFNVKYIELIGWMAGEMNDLLAGTEGSIDPLQFWSR